MKTEEDKKKKKKKNSLDTISIKSNPVIQHGEQHNEVK